MRGPEAVGGGEDELADAEAAAGLGDVAGAVDVGGPEGVVVDGVVGEEGGAVEDGGRSALFGRGCRGAGVADVALDAGEVGVGVGVGDEVDVGAAEVFGEEAAFEEASEEAGGSGDEDVISVGVGA